MARTFQVTIATQDEPVLAYQFAKQRAEIEPSSLDYPESDADMVHTCFQKLVIDVWRADYEASLVVRIQDTLDNAPIEVRREAKRALAGLQGLTHDEQALALKSLADMLGVP